MDRDGHKSLTTKAAAQVKGLARQQVAVIAEANSDADYDQVRSAIHFDNCAFPDGCERIAKYRRRFLEQVDRFSETSLRALGNILHTVQDFYAHSSWVDMQQELSPIPIWDFNMSSLPSTVVSGTWDAGFPKRCKKGAPMHDDIAKDDVDSPRGKLVVATGPNKGKTLLELTYDAALRATALQIRRFLAGICRYRITTVTGNLERAGSDANIFINIFDEAGVPTGRIYLNNVDHDDFKRGATDEFLVALRSNMSGVSKIEIGFEYDEHVGENPEWFLKGVTIENLMSGAKWSFRCDRWLSKDAADGKSIVTLWSARTAKKTAKPTARTRKRTGVKPSA